MSKLVDFATTRKEAGGNRELEVGEKETGLAVRLVGEELAVGVDDGGGGG